MKTVDPGTDWEDATTQLSTGHHGAFKAAWFLTASRLWPLVRSPRYGPFVLGVVLFILIAAMVVLSPATDSHFIYTDF